MRIEYQPTSWTDLECDLLAYPIFEDEPANSPALQPLAKATRGILADLLASGEFKPELHRTCKIHRPAGVKARRLLLLGAGKRASLDPARLRELAGTAVRQGRLGSIKTVAFLDRSDQPANLAARVASEGAIYGNFDCDSYKTRDREGRDVEGFILLGPRDARRIIEEGIRQGTVIGEATNMARTLSNEPANVLTPSQFAQKAASVGAEVGLEVEILEPEEMEKLGMHALLAVSKGSEQPPKMIVLRLGRQTKQARAGAPFYALVGKGVTFDSGGISLKPADKMEDMKADMSGGAAVLCAMTALARLHPKQRVMGVIPLVENLPGGRATKPGDIVKSYLGKTVEIINTDAEGRLILADALAYAGTLGATHLIDIATLTGACIVALGKINAGVMGTDQKLIDRLLKNCSVTGEKLWQLPLDDEYRKAIRSEIADIKNIGNRYGGAITAGKFLQEFVEKRPWVHLDIAGVDLDHDGRPFAAKGATGFGVRTLVQMML
jgi:leucyl aminopeptidase